MPLAIFEGLSGFHSAHRTTAQRGWPMTWLVIGVAHGERGVVLVANMENWEQYNWLLSGDVVRAIGGFVAVDEMLRRYGSCIRIN